MDKITQDMRFKQVVIEYVTQVKMEESKRLMDVTPKSMRKSQNIWAIPPRATSSGCSKTAPA